jgi:hypothetical protein
MTRARLELLQWCALLGGPLAWATQHVVGFFVADGACSATHVSSPRALEIALAVLAGAAVVAAEAAALVVFRVTRTVPEDAPGPYGRLRFFAEAALLGNVLFFVIVVLDGVGSVVHLPCRLS